MKLHRRLQDWNVTFPPGRWSGAQRSYNVQSTGQHSMPRHTGRWWWPGAMERRWRLEQVANVIDGAEDNRSRLLDV